ncbi:ATP-grasp domain-containing protein [Flavisolibacter tropicus]|uniref:ATP-grasp domain-containing protein n=1 Tax=Flavisolibacter tropicus TaxID=1492898 RepID=A0A172TWT6_9BACT|nr:ATP-grasp domain-containing protein [Flavisolibacter tropicus]ANE51466.1 hypothetical protein SY85_14090 [Flavisolibacter tropicus]
MKQTPILVLEYKHEDWLTANTLYCLGCDKQWEIHFITYRSKSAFRYLPFVKSYHHFDEETHEISFINFVELVTEKTKAAVLVPTNSAAFQFVIRHKEALQSFIQVIPTPQPWAYEIACDKGQLAHFMGNHQIATPLTIIDLNNDLKKQLDGFPFPVLLKPRIGAGGKGVGGELPITVFANKDELMACIQQPGIIDKYIIQSFVDGYIVGCNVLYKDGKLVAYTIQKGIVKAKSFAPSPGLEFIQNDAAIEVVDSLLSKLQWNGVANIDLIYDVAKQQILILEINARFWQTVGGSTVGAHVNFPSLACLQALNRPIEPVSGQLGRYVPLIAYIKHKLAAKSGVKIDFQWKEIDMRYFFWLLPAKVYRFYRARFQKKVPGLT